MNSHLQNMIKGRLWVKILIALFLGIFVGFLLGPDAGLVDQDKANVIGNWLALPGQIFLSLIQMIVVPLVFASIITGLASSEDMEQLKKLGIRAVLFFVITTTIAIIIGLAIADLIQPGQYIDNTAIEVTMEGAVGQHVDGPIEAPSITEMPQVIANILPDNPLGAMVEKQMLQVVLFAVILGMAILAMAPQQAKILLDLLGAIQEVAMTVVKWAMVLAPFAVFGLIAQTTIRTGLDALLGMTVYMGSVILGLFILLIFYLMIVATIIRQPIGWFMKSIKDVQLLAFSTSSSAAVMPLSIKTAEDKLGVRPSTSQFIIPLGATINMNGTALYQGVATMFLAQVYQIELSMAALALVVVTTVGASIGSPATPGVGIVILAMVLSSVGIPPEGIALILGVDRILDMTRTAINVTGDLTACLVMDKWIKG
ncbi:Na+:H+ dicarboxylate symporter [Desulfuribacillus alkaliarsenatis]|uniref:Na+:H+ dicarboxylate symporter n=2 Tax=Desulfuribacillus alkaliarsenatis TaxID=766136 RepID=A0A1E5G1W8_9FIRM|nr:Na+:H+ dicarboxylate symporter [Desulfuribacillus alkaliarsenatis]